MKKEYIIPIFVPHLGCPNDCTFCNQKKISGQKTNIGSKDVKDIIENYLSNFNENAENIEIAFFGGSFTGIDLKLQEDLLSVAYEYIQNGKVSSIRVSTRPDYIDRERLDLLKKYGVKTIELGVQSTNNFVLNQCRRGHTFEDVKKASKMIRKYKFTLGHQMMVGLPDSYQRDEIKTAKDLIKLKPKIIRIYPVLVIKDTQLAKEYLDGEYEPNTLQQAIETCATLLRMFIKKKINVIRIGLQTTDEICSLENKDSQVIAGPYHPAFRQLVESRIMYDEIIKKIKPLNNKIKHVTFVVNKALVNNFIGHKKENIDKIKNIYNINVDIQQSEDEKNFRIVSVK